MGDIRSSLLAFLSMIRQSRSGFALFSNLKSRWVSNSRFGSVGRGRRSSALALALLFGLAVWATTALGYGNSAVNAQELIGASPTAAALWTRASFPVENFQTYTSPFGYRTDPYNGNRRFHYGLDLAAPNGSYIRNWWAGSVLWVEDDGACGTSIAIQSGEWTHIYCHMQGHVETDGNGAFLVDRDGGIMLREGQQINSGARIGRVGMTGRTTGPHLHWGLKYQGNWVDPALVLRAMYLSQRATL
jgi:murein DD-endopeptidase MepM/ murein hydrolase activator NlpD